jgi:ribonuclease R
MHRALEPLLENPPGQVDRLPISAHCAEIADHISTTERTSASAEEESRRLKMLEWLQRVAQDREPRVFQAVITDVRRIGLMVEALDLLQRGLVKRDEFPPGDWRYEAHSKRENQITVNRYVTYQKDIWRLMEIHMILCFVNNHGDITQR